MKTAPRSHRTILPVTTGPSKAVVTPEASGGEKTKASKQPASSAYSAAKNTTSSVVDSRVGRASHAHKPINVQGPVMLRHTAAQQANNAQAWGLNPAGLLPDALLPVPKGQLQVKAERGVSGDNGLPNTAVLQNGRYDIPRLGLAPAHVRAVEQAFIQAYLADPAAMVAEYRSKFVSSSQQIFETDGAKQLFPSWQPDAAFKAAGPEEKAATKAFRGTYNSALHQVAHAVVKQAFLQRLDEIEKDPAAQVMVTCGGCVAGKGSLHKIADQDPKLKSVVERIAQHGATFDAAGEQHATDNAWILAQCQKRNIPVTFVYVHNDPELRVGDQFGRAAISGRLVPGKEFVRSYMEGGRTMADFTQSPEFLAAKEAGLVNLVIIDNSKTTYQDGVETNRAVRLATLPEVHVDETRALQAYAQTATRLFGEGKVPRAVYSEAVRELAASAPEVPA